MADLAANQAKDSHTSAQYTLPADRVTEAPIEAHARNDVTHWITNIQTPDATVAPPIQEDAPSTNAAPP